MIPFRNLEHTKSSIFTAIHAIPPEASKSVSMMLKEIAAELDIIHQVMRQNAEQEKEIALHFKRLEAIPMKIETYMAKGDTLNTAKSKIKRTDGIPLETIDHYWKKHVARHQRRLLAERDIKIMQRCRQGWTNAMISDEIGISVRQVQRIISKNLRG